MSEDSAPRPVRDGLAIAFAVGLVGIAFGVFARSSGLSVAKTCALSLLVFSGASQFAAVTVVAGGGSIASAIGGAQLLALRNALYGPIVARWFRRSVPERLALAQLVIDESTGVGAAQPDANERDAPLARRGFVVAGIGVYVCWNVATLIGALAGGAIGDPERIGLDAVFPAAYVALLAPHLRSHPGRVAALTAAVVTLVALPVLPAGVPILLAALGVVPAAIVAERAERRA